MGTHEQGNYAFFRNEKKLTARRVPHWRVCRSRPQRRVSWQPRRRDRNPHSGPWPPLSANNDPHFQGTRSGLLQNWITDLSLLISSSVLFPTLSTPKFWWILQMVIICELMNYTGSHWFMFQKINIRMGSKIIDIYTFQRNVFRRTILYFNSVSACSLIFRK